VTTITHERTAPPGVPEPGDEAPVAVAGILDAAENQAFLRTSGYRLGRDDVYVPMSLARQTGLRKGDQVTGAARARRSAGGDRRSRGDRAQEKYRVLARVDTVSGM
jgi:transcription termination factor Rho